MIESPRWLLPAYAFNILILVPVCYSMFLGGGVASVFAGRVAGSSGLRLMVGSLWLAILLASVAGLRWPALFAPVLPIQVLYKSVWLATFVLPLLRSGRPIPLGITLVFAIIALGYPFLLWASMRPSSIAAASPLGT